MPWLSVPIQRAFSLSKNNAPTFRVLPSNSGVTNGFQTPCITCCTPKLRLGEFIPTHTEPSALAARPLTLSIPSFDFKSPKTNVLDEPGFQRTTAVSLPIQRFPRVSSTRAPAPSEPDIPSALP